MPIDFRVTQVKAGFALLLALSALFGSVAYFLSPSYEPPNLPSLVVGLHRNESKEVIVEEKEEKEEEEKKERERENEKEREKEREREKEEQEREKEREKEKEKEREREKEREKREKEEEDYEPDEPPLCPLPAKVKPKPNEIYFLHIPKAGGSAFVLVLLHFMGPRIARFEKDCYLAQNGPNNPVPCNFSSPPCRRVINCVDHIARLKHLGREGVPSITILREPVARLVSGWHFQWPHRPSYNLNQTFTDYINTVNYQNVATRMFAGKGYPYHPIVIKSDDFEYAYKNLMKFTLVAIQEAFITSIKLFFALLEQPPLDSDSIYFRPQELERDVKLGHGVRENRNPAYNKFKKEFYKNKTRLTEMHTKNHYDLILYHTAVQLFCHKLSRFPCLLKDPIVIKELNQKSLCTYLFTNGTLR